MNSCKIAVVKSVEENHEEGGIETRGIVYTVNFCNTLYVVGGYGFLCVTGSDLGGFVYPCEGYMQHLAAYIADLHETSDVLGV